MIAVQGNPSVSPQRRAIRGIAAVLVAAVAALSAPPLRAAGGCEPPQVPANLEVPAGHRAWRMFHAVGTQNYVCLPRTTGTGLGWTFLGPQASLFDEQGEQVTTHFLSTNPVESLARATWQHSRDTSAVWAAAIASSTDPEYVAPGAIPWLLLQAVGSESGPTGGERLVPVTYIQRVNTEGGVAPAGDCPSIGARVLVPYETDYVFYRAR